MTRKSIFNLTACIMAVVMVVITIVTFLSTGKTKVSYTADVKVAGGAVTGEAMQTVILQAEADKCTFELSASGPNEIVSTISGYRVSASAEGLFSVAAAAEKMTKEATGLAGKNVLITFEQKLKDGANLADGNYQVTYKVVMKEEVGGMRKFLSILLAAEILALFLWILYLEGDKESECTKKQMRMRGRAYSGAFYVMAMTTLAFALLSNVVSRFPFSTFQAGIIVILAGASAFLILANRMNAYTQLSAKRGTVFAVFLIAAILNLVAAMISLLGKTSVITPSGTGMVKNGAINLIAAACLLIVAIDLSLKGGSTRSASRPRPERRERVRQEQYDSYSEPASDDSIYDEIDQ